MVIPAIEFKSRVEIENEQLERLKATLSYVANNSNFYKKHFNDNGVNIDDIQSITDLQSIPPISKKELQQFNKDFWCVSSDKLIDYCNTSGTEGQPVTIPLSENDLPMEQASFMEEKSTS